MRAALTLAPGGPIQVRQVPDPEAKSGEVLVRVRAASVNRLDRAVFDGTGLGAAAEFPLIQGIDAAGTVDTGGGAFQPGMRVVVKPTIACRRCRPCRAGRKADCQAARTMGVHRPGGFAEMVNVPRANVMAVPAGVDHIAAAAAAHTHPVVLRMIRNAGFDQGETVLVTSAGGAIGPASIQVARALGARVLAVASSEAKTRQARDLGAEPVARDGSLAERLLDLTDGAGVDLVLDASGHPEVLQPALDALGHGGRVAVIGTHAGSHLEVDLDRLYRRRQRIVGSASSSDTDFHDAFRLIAEHRIGPVIAAVHPLEEAETAMASMTDRDRIGKVVVEVTG
jgi:NADPH:quinone reductase-like Zn-dependent oxidoreductase